MEISDKSSNDQTFVRCAYSGQSKPLNEMVQVGEHWIAEEHKNSYVQFIQQGGELQKIESAIDAPTSLNFTALFSAAWSLYKKHFWLLTSLYLTIWLPCNFLTSYMEAHELIKDTLAASWRANQWMEVLFGGLATGAIMHVIKKALDGQSSNYWEALGFSLKKWFTLILAAFLLNLITVIGFILLVVPGVLMSVRGVFMISYIVDQNQSARDSIDSSWQLAKGHFWRILGYLLVVAVGALLPMTVLMFTLGIVQASLEEVIESEIVIEQFWLLDWIAESLGSITFAFLPVFYFVFYRGLRSINGKTIAEQFFKN